MDVDRIVGIERRGQCGKPRGVRRSGDANEFIKSHYARRFFACADQNHIFKIWKTLKLQSLVPGMSIDFWRQGFQHGHVVAGLQRARHDQHFALHFVKRVFQFRRAISRVDVDQNGADARRAKLRQQPLDTIRRPDADAIAALDAERQ